MLSCANLAIFKGCVCYICASLFWSLNESTCQTRKIFFYFTSKVRFPFSRKSNFRILHFQISWRHQMPKHKTRNTFHWSLNILGIKYSLLMKFGQFISYYIRKNFIKKFYKNCRPFCVCKEWSITFYDKCNFWSKLLILDM